MVEAATGISEAVEAADFHLVDATATGAHAERAENRLLRLDWFDSEGLGSAAPAAQRNGLKIGKAEADSRVERSLYERANGYTYDAVKIFMPAGAKKPIYAPYVEHMPPDPTSMIFWLKNRDPERWRDVQQLEHSLGRYVISDKPLTEEQWAKERADVIDAQATEVLSPPLSEDNDETKK
jgi:hypothetical protein